MGGLPMKLVLSVSCTVVVVASGVVALLTPAAVEVPEAPREVWRSWPAFYGIADVLIGTAVLVSLLAPDWLVAQRSRVSWSGGAYGAKPPPNEGFIWNPWSLLMSLLCLVGLPVAALSADTIVWELVAPQRWPAAVLGAIHIYVVGLLFRATRRVLSEAPS